MTVKVRMPLLASTMVEGTLRKWHVQEGDRVVRGQILAEIETDKVVTELDSRWTGTVTKLLVPEGAERVPVNSEIAILTTRSAAVLKPETRTTPKAASSALTAAPSLAGDPAALNVGCQTSKRQAAQDLARYRQTKDRRDRCRYYRSLAAYYKCRYRLSGSPRYRALYRKSIDAFRRCASTLVCIHRVNRTFDGSLQSEATGSYSCRSGDENRQTRRFRTRISWRMTASKLDCDESVAVLPDSLLEAAGTTVAREDGFAHFLGRFKISVEEPGGARVTRFTGQLELIGRSGSHQGIGESCDQKQHLEGWIKGKGKGALAKYILRGAVVAQADLPDGAAGNTEVNRITGTLLRRA